jgi:hypothetical protein
MNNEVFEETQGAEGGAKAKLEKQARQLAYDTKYKVKQAMSANKGGKLDPAAVRRAYLSQLAKSPAPPAVKALARKKLLGEEYINANELANTSMVNAMVKVFQEGISTEEPEQIEEESTGSDKKFYIKVTDKKTGNTYRRWATRAKISELRSNPNIASVEMTKYGEQDEKEKTKGSQTAAVKSGKGLDPVGKEDDDPDNDGVPISKDKNDQYIMKRRNAIGKAISSRKSEKVTESFLSDWRNELFERNDEKNDNKKLDLMKGENKIIVSPEISEKLNLTKADMGNVVKDFYKSDAPQFKGRTKEERRKMAIAAERGGKKLGEECGCEDTEKKGEGEDTREMKTKANLVKNKFRAMGLKMSQDLEGEQLDENPMVGLGIKAGLAAGTALAGKAVFDKAKGVAGKLKERNKKTEDAMKQLRQSYDPEGEVIDESEIGDRARRVVGDQRQGVHGFSDAVNKDQKAIQQNLLKIRPYGVKGFPSAKKSTNKTTQVAHYEMDGEVIEQVTTQTQFKPLSSSGSTGYNKPPAAPTLPPPSAVKSPKKPPAKQPHKPNPSGYAIRGNTFSVEDSQINGELLDERTRERKGQPRKPRDRAMEVVRSMPNVKQGLMTRSGKTVAQHEAERGVPESDRPKRPEQTTAGRLKIKKQKEAAAKAAAERAREEETRRRRLA